MSTLGNNLRNSLRRAIISLMVGVFVFTAGALGALAQTPPPEDVCAGALAVTPGAGGVQTFNIDATSSPDDPELSCTMGPGFGSVFFTFVATDTSARIRTDLDSVALDSDFAVYDVTQSDQCNTQPWAEVGCSEDGEFLFNGDTCIEGLVVGNTYKIMLLSFTAGSSGDYTLEIEGPCVEPPPDTEDPVVTAPGDIDVNTDAGQPTAVVTFADATATDNVGVETLVQTAGPSSGSKFLIGLTVVTWTATDAAGNPATGSTNITVTDKAEFAFIGFLPPVENLPALNPVKGGRAVPVKWQIPDGNGGYISDLSVVASMQFAPVACGSQDTSQTLDLTDVETTGKTRLRYDSTDEQFVLNWKTSKGMKGKCFFFVLDLTDGTSHFAGFRVK